MKSIYSKMYGGSPRYSDIQKPSTTTDLQKSAVRQLSGMKVHGSHVKTVEVGGELVDVPKIEYVRLLDDQLKDARERIKALETEVERSTRRYNRLLATMQAFKADLDKTVKYK